MKSASFLMDRDSKFSAAFRQVLSDAGTEPVRLPPQSPNLNAHMERFWRSLREECTDRMVFFGETMLRSAVREFVLHFHGERNHQGLEKIFTADLHRSTAGSPGRLPALAPTDPDLRAIIPPSSQALALVFLGTRANSTQPPSLARL